LTPLREGPPLIYVPVLRLPWLFPQLPGVQRWRLEHNGDRRPICLVTGERVECDANTGKSLAKARR